MNQEFKPFDLGRYRCVEIIGSGDTAIVYKAVLHTVEGFEKTYALKKIHPHLIDNRAFMQAFLQEIRISAMLNHGNIAHVRELNKEEGCYYLVVEFIDGRDLRGVLDRVRERKSRVPWELAAYITMEAAKALSYIHEKKGFENEHLNLVHRSLSPSNVILSKSGEVKLVDFGMNEMFPAGESNLGGSKEKYAYMSPEQLTGEKVDRRSDIFTLGALFYEMLAGKPPFKGETDEDTIHLVKEAKAVPIKDTEPLLDEVLAKMSARNPENRFKSAEDVMTALNRILMVRAKSVFEKNLAEYLSGLFDELEPRAAVEKPVVFGSPAGEGYRSYETDEGSMVATDVYTNALYKRDHSSEERSEATTNVGKLNRAMSAQAITPSYYEKNIGSGLGASYAHDSNEVHTPIREKESWRSARSGYYPQSLLQTPPSLVFPRPHVVSSCEPEYGLQPGHFVPAEEPVLSRREPDPYPSRRKFKPKQEIKPAWTFRNRLIMVLALLSILVASAALYIVFSSDDRVDSISSETWTAENDPEPQTHSVKINETREKKIENAVERQEPADQEAEENKILSYEDRTPDKTLEKTKDETKSGYRNDEKEIALSGGIHALKASGPRTAGDLDLYTQPSGAVVIVEGRSVAKTPVRFKIPEGQTLEVVLNKEGRRLKIEQLKAPGDQGRMLKVFLPNVRKKAVKAETGQTAVEVRCKTPEIYRIYLNGWDTGFNCPVTIRVDPGNNNVARRIEPEARLDYKDFRVHTGHTAIVDWDE